MVTRWQVIAVMKALVVALRPPVLPVESAEVTNGVPVVDDEESARAVGCRHSGP
jgi:hypothetical protein